MHLLAPPGSSPWLLPYCYLKELSHVIFMCWPQPLINRCTELQCNKTAAVRFGWDSALDSLATNHPLLLEQQWHRAMLCTQAWVMRCLWVLQCPNLSSLMRIPDEAEPRRGNTLHGCNPAFLSVSLPCGTCSLSCMPQCDVSRLCSNI